MRVTLSWENAATIAQTIMAIDGEGIAYSSVSIDDIGVVTFIPVGTEIEVIKRKDDETTM